MHISSNLEDYLEAIYHLQNEKRVARAKDIAERLDVTRASVTGALKNLSDKHLINYEPYSFVTLTPSGEKMASEIIRRHDVLRDFFENILLLEPTLAEANACRAEHAVDESATRRLIDFMRFVRDDSGDKTNWREGFGRFCGGTEPGGPAPSFSGPKKTRKSS
jgi:DtxR family Mn-dependent transcriptional regulator